MTTHAPTLRSFHAHLIYESTPAFHRAYYRRLKGHTMGGSEVYRVRGLTVPRDEDGRYHLHVSVHRRSVTADKRPIYEQLDRACAEVVFEDDRVKGPLPTLVEMTVDKPQEILTIAESLNRDGFDVAE